VNVRTVTVDFWGTLMLDSPASDDRYQNRRMAGFQDILRRHGVHCSGAQLARAYDASGDYLRRVWSTGRDVPVDEHVAAILRALDGDVPERLVPAVMHALVDAYAGPILLVPPAVDTTARAALQRIRDAGIKLVIVSNTMRTPGATLRRLLARFDLLDCFDHALFSDEFGIRKPDPKIFQAALEAVGGDVQAAVHVGDDPTLDVRGARAAGLRVVQIVTAGSGVPPVAEAPDRTITRLEELPAAVASLDAD
jgi:HAD superfamily hydrolase (TIGR01509 family)